MLAFGEIALGEDLTMKGVYTSSRSIRVTTGHLAAIVYVRQLTAYLRKRHRKRATSIRAGGASALARRRWEPNGR